MRGSTSSISARLQRTSKENPSVVNMHKPPRLPLPRKPPVRHAPPNTDLPPAERIVREANEDLFSDDRNHWWRQFILDNNDWFPKSHSPNVHCVASQDKKALFAEIAFDD